MLLAIFHKIFNQQYGYIHETRSRTLVVADAPKIAVNVENKSERSVAYVYSSQIFTRGADQFKSILFY